MKDLFQLSADDLNLLYSNVRQEIHRRTDMEFQGCDPATSIWANEMGKRAASVAIAGNHTILFFGPKNSGKTMLRALCHELGLSTTFESRTCPCGEHNNYNTPCPCTVDQITETMSKMPKADIYIEVCRPREREINQRGTSLEDIRKRLKDIAKHKSLKLDEHAEVLLKHAKRELGIDPEEDNRIIAVARTIANMEDSKPITAGHMAEAINYRRPRLIN